MAPGEVPGTIRDMSQLVALAEPISYMFVCTEHDLRWRTTYTHVVPGVRRPTLHALRRQREEGELEVLRELYVAGAEANWKAYEKGRTGTGRYHWREPVEFDSEKARRWFDDNGARILGKVWTGGTADKFCPGCGFHQPMMTARKIKGRLPEHEEAVVCDATCSGAVGASCVCPCAGRNHGRDLELRAERFWQKRG